MYGLRYSFCHVGMELNGLTSGCPIHNLIPEWNDLVYRGRWKEAFERLAKRITFQSLRDVFVQHRVKDRAP